MFRRLRGDIEISLPDHLVGVYPHPTEARTEMPPAYRALPPEIKGSVGATVKRCAPFLDAMTEGVIVPLPFDLEVEVSDGGAEVAWSSRPGLSDWKTFGLDGSAISPVAQSIMGDLSAQPVVKIETPYWVRTKPGTSLLVTTPLNRWPYLQVAAGIVDADRFDTRLKAFVYWLGPDGRFLLEAGTPLLQLIAIPRVPGRLKISKINFSEVSERQKSRLRTQIAGNVYRNNWRASRKYKNEI
jgi:hypothetical protein